MEITDPLHAYIPFLPAVKTGQAQILPIGWNADFTVGSTSAFLVNQYAKISIVFQFAIRKACIFIFFLTMNGFSCCYCWLLGVEVVRGILQNVKLIFMQVLMLRESRICMQKQVCLQIRDFYFVKLLIYCCLLLFWGCLYVCFGV